MKAAIYARYSSENQRESSIEDQLRLCRHECERRGYAVTHTFHDAELSGSLTQKRPGLQAMMAAAKRREVDVVVCDDSSRLSRDSAEAQKLFKRLEFYGVGLICRTDGVDTIANPKSSRLVFNIKGAMSEEFLRDLGEKTHRGQEGRILAGFSAGGLPYGYRSAPVADPSGAVDRYGQPKVIGYKRVIHEPEAAIVRRIFRWYVGEETGHPLSPRQIAHRLNEEGVLPPGARWQNRTVRTGTTWSYTAILSSPKLGKGILHNVAYLGLMRWNKSRWRRDPDTEAYAYTLRPQDDWVERRDESLRIIEQPLWDAVQARLTSMRRGVVRAEPAAKYLLSGLLKCGVCGANFIITNRFTYRCSAARNRGATVCANGHSVSRVRVERAILSALRDVIYTPERLTALVSEVRTRLLDRAKHHRQAETQDAATSRLATIETEMTNIRQAVVTGKATSELLSMLEDRARERDALQARQTAHQAPDLHDRLESILQRLPDVVQSYVEDLHTLLASQQIDHGRDVLAGLGIAEVRLHPLQTNGTRHLEAQIRGDVQRVLQLAASKPRGGQVQIQWLGEEDSNPH